MIRRALSLMTGGAVLAALLMAAHPAAAQTRLRVPFAGLRGEVHDGMDRLEVRPGAPGETMARSSCGDTPRRR